MANKKREALSVARLISEVLVDQLGIPLLNIVNDTSFQQYTQSRRPDILISNEPYTNNPNDADEDKRFIDNLICYVEAKDVSCKVGDADWLDALEQGKTKAPKLHLSYFGVTNCSATYFYNLSGERLKLNGNPLTEFQTIDVLRIIRKKTDENPLVTNIEMGVDSLTAVSEAVFNARLWQLKNIYRAIDFGNNSNSKKIDFTVGLISLEYYEEKAKLEGSYDTSLSWWSTAVEGKDPILSSSLSGYIERLISDESDFREFSAPIEVVKSAIAGGDACIKTELLREIVDVIDGMKPLHGTGFDLFGAVYEAFANSKEKKEFGEYFTRRNYAHILAKLLLTDKQRFDGGSKFTIIDPFCGTGGMLTESYKVLRQNFKESNTLTDEAIDFLSNDCFYGIDLRGDNASRSRLNMFLVGDGHNHIYSDDSFSPQRRDGVQTLNQQYDYVITNPPYGQGTVTAESVYLTSKRMEIAAICKVIDLLKVEGKGCIIVPDGVLENPTFKSFREELLLTCEVQSIISLPKFAFAPYTKEKTYAILLTKRYERLHPKVGVSTGKRTRQNGKYQTASIWMYIVDNDGFANSDKRYPTRLRDERQRWLHDELSGWVDLDGNERPSLLEQRWRERFDDKALGGTTWTSESGEDVTLRKAGHIRIEDVKSDGFLTLLPERWLRPYLPSYITPQSLFARIEELMSEVGGVYGANKTTAKYTESTLSHSDISFYSPQTYQAKDVSVSVVFDCMSGNTGLTERLIYLHSGDSVDKSDKYEVLSGATTADKHMGLIPLCTIPQSTGGERQLKTFEDREGLLVVRKGKAGTTRYLRPGRYTINEDAYILSIKESCPYEVDLRWFSIAYKNILMSYSSNSANATWNKTGFFANATIDIPSIESQRELVDIVQNAKSRIKALQEYIERFDTLINLELSPTP